MKRWPLRWKIACYAASLGVIATIAGAATTWTIMQYWEIHDLNVDLTNAARQIAQHVSDLSRNQPVDETVLQQTLAPMVARYGIIEVNAANGQTLYRSSRLPENVTLAAKSSDTREIDHHGVRLARATDGGVTVIVGNDLQNINRIGRDIIFGMFGAIPTVLLVVAIGGRWVAGCALGPVEQIREAARRITPQRLNERLPVPEAHDEIAGLVEVLNRTFDRLQGSFEQSIRFSAEASHHLKTPLCILRSGVEEILSDQKTSTEQQARAAELLHEVHQLTSIVENLLLLARSDAGRLDLQREEFDFRELLDGVCDDVRVLAESKGIRLEAKLPEYLPLSGDRRLISLIVQNLVENAVKYNDADGLICIYAQHINGVAELRVLNSGTPIPPERAPHIFERFYRARNGERNGGSGLGLTIACALAKAHGGDLELVRSNAEGTELRLTLPSRSLGDATPPLGG
jgi:signal transduction histidine kinase